MRKARKLTKDHFKFLFHYHSRVVLRQNEARELQLKQLYSSEEEDLKWISIHTEALHTVLLLIAHLKTICSMYVSINIVL